MSEFDVSLTLEAISDIADIVNYIDDKFGKVRANRFYELLKKELVKLKYIAGLYGQTSIYYRNYQIYKKPFSPSIIFYVVDELERKVHVLRVLREERNWKTVLKDV